MRHVLVLSLVSVLGCGGGEGDGPPGGDGDDAGPGSDGAVSSSDGAVSSSDGAPARDGAVVVAPDGGPGPGPTRSCPFTKDSLGFFDLASPMSSYTVHLPADYDVQNPTPRGLLVALHGCGDMARNFAQWGAVAGSFRASHDYIAISLGGREGACWTVPGDGALVMAAIDHVRSCFWVHQKKIAIAGYSSGGILAYDFGLRHAAMFAGILIENSGLPGNADALLSGAAWKLHIGHSARLSDGSFPIAGVRAGRDKLLAAGFPLEYRELPGSHDGTSDDWSMFLLPKLAGWMAP
ncbi:MAG: hypothetical protein IT370_24900 [Deltaproteobacteria bacterium]|nr:hypothetical protein [Deltaproteobacteria bacterium]